MFSVSCDTYSLTHFLLAAQIVNDIALVKLAEDVPATPQEVSDIQSVDLPDQTNDLNWPINGDTCVLKGWGCTKIGI